MSDLVRRTKHERRVPLPAGLAPLLTQREIETYYGVSTWQIDQWRKAGMPDEPFAGQGRRILREERHALLGPELVAQLRRIRTNPAGEVLKARPLDDCRGGSE
ncbi:hypothetical protein [Streptomyces lincolnensis]|uniref:hypothetical protein n=1 Tax=Streptomyces lincolnensis TaxID=1915 RepID=UPI0037CE62C8